MADQMDGQNLFHRILPAIASGLTSTAEVGWHLQVKDSEYNSGLTKSYCITVSMQKISSICRLIIKIQQIWRSHELNKWLRPFLTKATKKNKTIFSIPKFAPSSQKINLFHQFILEIQSVRVLWQDWLYPIILLTYLNLHQHAKNQAISLICSGDMVGWKILQFDWLRTLHPTSQEQKFSQIWDLCRNTANNTNFHYRTFSVKINDQIFQ